MNKKIARYEIFGFIFVSILGTLFHFVYNWSGKLFIVGLFTPINESPWEHLKLLFFPFFIYTIWQSNKLKQDKFCVYTGKLIGIIFGMLTTLSIFYVVSGASGKNTNWVNILSFFIGVGVAHLISYFLINNSIGNGTYNYLSFGFFIVISILFFIFTISAPNIPLFLDPITKTYGIQ